MSIQHPGQPRGSAAARHLAAVANSLGWAEESAAQGNYTDALQWLTTIEATGDKLSDDFETKREAWRTRLAQERASNREGARLSS